MLIDGKEIKVSPNQRVVVNNKEVRKDIDYKQKENTYTQLYVNTLNTALQVLSPTAFKLYIYFAKNKDKYTFALSKVDVCQSLHITVNTYLKSFNELEALGYLV